MSEFVEGFEVVDGLKRPAVAVFGSARLGVDDPEYDRVRRTTELLAEEGYAIITGGGPGLMEAANRGATEGHGPSAGLNIKLPAEQMPNHFAEVQVTFDFFPVRKALFSYVSVAVIAATGGFGTLDELFTIATLRQTGKIAPIPIYLLGSEHWQPLLNWFRASLVPRGTISPADVDGLLVFDDPAELVADLRERTRWLGPQDLRRI
jgi:uncharacterized protein (TIGR00730 family)